MPRAVELASMVGMDEGMSEKYETKPQRKSTSTGGHDCSICRKSNMTLSGLKIHLLTHTGEKPYHCTICDKRFTCSSNLKKHQRIHNKDYIYECEVCGKTCSDPSNMKKHMTVHSAEKAYVCPSCGKSYSYAQSLRQHMDEVHVGNGEKRVKNKRKGHFPCPECGKVFGYYWRCSLHQARVHAVDKPFKCPECGKAFARETILNKHLQTHEKPYPCTQCDRKFSFRDQLNKHNRIHSGEKPFQCETCSRSFSQRGSLTEHIRTHTGLKPYICSICGLKFSSSSSLRRHERKVKSCFPPPPGEEFPIGSMFPRKVIYVPTPPAKISKVENTPVVCTQSSPLVQNSYIASSNASEISTSSSFRAENGIYQIPIVETAPTGSTLLPQNTTGLTSNNVPQISTSNSALAGNGTFQISKVETAWAGDTQRPPQSNTTPTSSNVSQISTSKPENGTYPAGGNGINTVSAMVPNNTNGQISMVVGCDKNGKIFVVPVTLQLVNGGMQSTGSNHQLIPVTMTTSNHYPPASGTGRPILPKPPVTMATNTPVAMATSNDHHPSTPTQSPTNSQPSLSGPTNAPVTIATPNNHRPEIPTQVYQPTFSILNNTPVAMETSNDHDHGYQNEPNLARDADEINQPMQQYPPMVESTNNPTESALPTNQITTSNGTIMTLANPSLDVKPVLPKIQQHSFTNQRPPSTSIARNGEHTNHNIPPYNHVTTPISNQTPQGDINNNMVSKMTNHFAEKYSATTANVREPRPGDVPEGNGSASIEQFNTPPSKLNAAINKLNNALRCSQPSSMFAEATLPVKNPVLTINGYHEKSPAYIPERSNAPIMEQSKSCCVKKTDQEDVKPIIGMDLPAFYQ